MSQGALSPAPLRVALLDCSDPARPGSMAAYARLVERVLEPLEGVTTERVRLSPGSGSRFAKLSGELRALAGRPGRRADVLHLLDGSHAYLLAGLPLRRAVVTVHDLIPALQVAGEFPVEAPGLPARTLISLSLHMLKRARGLCSVSEATASDLSTLVGRDVDLVLRSALPRSSPRTTERRARDVVLHVGNNGFYKNREGVVRIFARMQAQRPELSLVLAGPAPSEAVRQAVAATPHPERVIVRVDPEDAEVDRLYASASVLLFPSLYEGFGWPPLEALRAGCPVVASNRGALPEVVGTLGPLCDPLDEETFAARALETLQAAASEMLIGTRVTEHLQAFTEARMAQGLLALYETISDPVGDRARAAPRCPS